MIAAGLVGQCRLRNIVCYIAEDCMDSKEERLRRLYVTVEFSGPQGTLGKALEDERFVENLLLYDRAADWQLVREVGQYLVLASPDLLNGHVIVARACRRLISDGTERVGPDPGG